MAEEFVMVGESGGLVSLVGSFVIISDNCRSKGLVVLLILFMWKHAVGTVKTVIQQSFDFSSQYRQIFPFSILFNRIWYKVLFGSFDDSSSINGLFVFISLGFILEGAF